MPVECFDPSRWKPGAAWREHLARVRTSLTANPDDVHAWTSLVMMLGDTGAWELALAVALHAARLAPPDGQLRGHLALLVVDLGLGEMSPSGTVTPDAAKLDAFAATAADPWDALAQAEAAVG
jgi:hypothetical protein